MVTIKAAVIGSGNIGTDLFVKSRRAFEVVEVIATCGVDPASDGLALAPRTRLGRAVVSRRGTLGP